MNFRDFWLSNISAEKPQYKAVFFDVDGTIVSGGMSMPGAESTLQWLREIKTPFFCLIHLNGERGNVAGIRISIRRGSKRHGQSRIPFAGCLPAIFASQREGFVNAGEECGAEAPAQLGASR